MKRTPACLVALVLLRPLAAEAAAPPRDEAYAEPICNDHPDVFFCEDFEGEDLSVEGVVGNPNSYWNNPALSSTDIYWSIGGSHQQATLPITGFDAANRVWRVTKSDSFVDVDTGMDTGTGNGTIAGWLREEILGTGARDWYARIQASFSSDHSWPASLDFKMFFALPGDFIDPPSAVYETGIYLTEDFACQVNGSWTSAGGDVPSVRYGPAYSSFPELGDYCPWLDAGLAADGAHAPKLVKDRWYTLEYHMRLSSSETADDGQLELWVDGDKAYETTRNTCAGGCPDLGYVMILGWMNSADPQSGYYEIDNVVMSRSYIGEPGVGNPTSGAGGGSTTAQAQAAAASGATVGAGGGQATDPAADNSPKGCACSAAGSASRSWAALVLLFVALSGARRMSIGGLNA